MARKTNSRRLNVSLLILIGSIFFLTSSAIANIEDHITRTESGFYYTVQKGDTLWDLSKQFSDSAWEWPDLWSKNPQIANPHLIYPGQQLLIFKKEWEGMEKKETKEAVVVPVITSETVAPGVEPSIVKEKYHTFLGINKVGFIRKEPVSAVGIISKPQFDDKVLINSGDYMYILPTSDISELAVGGKYLTYASIGPIRHKDSFDVIGYQHLITGIIEITEIKSDYAVAKVEAAFRPIEINNLLMPYQARSQQIALKESVKGLTARIIKPEEDKALIGDNDIVFFNKGQNDGIEPGQSYAIYHDVIQAVDSNTNRSVSYSPGYIGKLLVLHTEPTTSTALILNSLRTIQSGQIVSSLEP